MIRKVIREGRSQGVSDSDILMYAKISAHSGLDIQFDKEATRINSEFEIGNSEFGIGNSEFGIDTSSTASGPPSPTGEGLIYADGFYEASKNRIVVNPEGKRTAERLLIHELDHAIRKYFDSEGKPATRIYFDAIEQVAPETREKILQKYKKTAKPGEVAATVMDETNAYYVEQVLGNKHTLEKLLEAEPMLKDKILSFFKGASSDYADVPKLSGAAKKYYRTYNKLFDEFGARNQQNNALEPNNNVFGSYSNVTGVSDNVRTTDDNKSKNAHLSTLFEKNSQKTSLTNMNQGKMHVSDVGVRYYALSDSYSEKDSIKSQLRQNESAVNDMSPVDNINYEVVDKMKAREDAKQLYKSLGYKVDRQNFGIIEIGEKEISESSNYLNTKAEFAAWMTVPKVLKRGKLISDHVNHKNEGFSTYTIAAPVVINGVRGNVAVTVKKTGKNRYKTHRILMPDGSQFVYEKTKTDAEPTGSDIILSDKNKGPDISSTSTNSIHQPDKKINPSYEISLENSSDKQFALDIDSEGEVNEDGSISGAVVMSWLKDKHSDGKAFDAESVAARGLPYKSGRSTLTVGELRKVLANSRNDKVFSKGDALNVVNRMSGAWGLTQKARDEIADVVWQFLNEAQNLDGRREIAEGIAEYITAKVLVDSKTENPDALAAAERITLRSNIIRRRRKN